MTLRHPDTIGAVAITVVATLVIVGALTGPDPGFGVVRPATFPVAIGIFMLASAAWLGFDTVRRSTPASFEEVDLRPLGLTVLAAAVFLLAFVPVGFVPTAIPYLVVQARILGSRALVRDAIASIVFVLAIYFLFVRFLSVDLPNGPLPF